MIKAASLAAHDSLASLASLASRAAHARPGLRTGLRLGLLGIVAATLAACGGLGISSGDSGFGGKQARARAAQQETPITRMKARRAQHSTIWDLFSNKNNPNVTIEVNKYLWQASLEVLDFMPVKEADPFSGIISMGYGTPPGGHRAYSATVYVQDPALDARSLKLALRTRSGPASPATVRALEDAIMTRARQLRIRDSKL